MSKTLSANKLSNLDNTYKYKSESLIILICILIIIIGYLLYWVIKKISIRELFDNDSRREKMKRIYKSDEISDPDEQESSSSRTCFDPDCNGSMDPD